MKKTNKLQLKLELVQPLKVRTGVKAGRIPTRVCSAGGRPTPMGPSFSCW
jgi:hypothetical protein